MQNPTGADLAFFQLVFPEIQPASPAGKNSPFAALPVDNNECALASSAWLNQNRCGINGSRSKTAQVKTA
jgi:hypothetical protein